MKIEEFWNRAFLAALVRLPAEAAKKEADEATKVCLKHWQEHRFNWAPAQLLRWQELDIALAPWPISTPPEPKDQPAPAADPA